MVQLTPDKAGTDVRRFLEHFGFQAAHAATKWPLSFSEHGYIPAAEPPTGSCAGPAAAKNGNGRFCAAGLQSPPMQDTLSWTERKCAAFGVGHSWLLYAAGFYVSGEEKPFSAKMCLFSTFVEDFSHVSLCPLPLNVRMVLESGMRGYGARTYQRHLSGSVLVPRLKSLPILFLRNVLYYSIRTWRQRRRAPAAKKGDE